MIRISARVHLLPNLSPGLFSSSKPPERAYQSLPIHGVWRRTDDRLLVGLYYSHVLDLPILLVANELTINYIRG